MARKVFISVLGYSNYSKCYYTRTNENFKSSEVRYVQEATLQYLFTKQCWNEGDVAYVLLTKGAEQKNWEDDGHIDFGIKESIKQTGLKSQLRNMHLPLSVIPIKNLPDGNDEKEIWKIFEQVFAVIQDKDELYFDLTHGFRYLPMLVLVLGNYSKFLKNVTIKSITYGNYEARNRDTNEAPIIDLAALSELQDWTSASASFLKSGNIAMLKTMCKKTLKPILKESKGSDKNAKAMSKYMDILENVVEDMNTCRGVNILEGNNFVELFKQSSILTEVMIEPMNPVINKLKDSFSGFVPAKNILNGYMAAKWCFDNNLYQQALTILHETIISHVCESMGWDVQNIEDRDSISKAFNIYNDIINRGSLNCKEEQIKQIEKALNNECLKVLASTFVVTTNLRNDYNHAGMRSNPVKRDKLINNLQGRLEVVFSMINDQKICS